jgi:hypothetical protein
VKRLVLFLMALALGLAACDSGSKPEPTPSPSTARPSSTAVLRIDSPTPGQTVSTAGVTVKMSLVGGRIVPSGSRDLKPDEGHVHLVVDGETITLTGGLTVPTGKLTPGAHLIQVEFAASDHGPFNPRVIQQVTVTAE